MLYLYKNRGGFMIDTIEVTIDGKVYNYTKGITLQEIYSEHQDGQESPLFE